MNTSMEILQPLHFVSLTLHYMAVLVSLIIFTDNKCFDARSHWQLGLRCGSVAAHLLGLPVRISLLAWVSVLCESCVLSG